MERIGRQRRSESAWRELMERHAQSGLAVSEFCKLEGIKSASLYGWRSRLREGLQGKPSAGPMPKGTISTESPPAGFIDLGSLGSGVSRFEIRLELGHGVALHLVGG